jgi:hypothetical protein
MYTDIVKATRTHYAALQHRPSGEREALHYTVKGSALPDPNYPIHGTIWVKTKSVMGSINTGKRKREMTKLNNRLSVMYPEAYRIEVWYE